MGSEAVLALGDQSEVQAMIQQFPYIYFKSDGLQQVQDLKMWLIDVFSSLLNPY